jgi:hypothetical protein
VAYCGVPHPSPHLLPLNQRVLGSSPSWCILPLHQNSPTFQSLPLFGPPPSLAAFLSSAIQSGLTSNAPAGATPLTTPQNVTAYDEGNGTVIYSARVTVTKTDSSGNTYTYPVTLTVDAAGNPTTLPGGSFAALPRRFGGGLCA